MTTKTKKPIYPPPTKKVERWEDVPVFKDEHEEARFWAAHGLAGEALESMQPVPVEGDDWLPPARKETIVRRVGGAKRRGNGR